MGGIGAAIDAGQSAAQAGAIGGCAVSGRTGAAYFFRKIPGTLGIGGGWHHM